MPGYALTQVGSTHVLPIPFGCWPWGDFFVYFLPFFGYQKKIEDFWLISACGACWEKEGVLEINNECLPTAKMLKFKTIKISPFRSGLQKKNIERQEIPKWAWIYFSPRSLSHDGPKCSVVLAALGPVREKKWNFFAGTWSSVVKSLLLLFSLHGQETK